MKRRKFVALLAAAVAGFVTLERTPVQADEVDAKTLTTCKALNKCKARGGCATGDHGCPGKNSCKGKGGCAQSNHVCKGFNICRGFGGCKSSDQGCKGKNACRGKGGCAWPKGLKGRTYGGDPTNPKPSP